MAKKNLTIVKKGDVAKVGGKRERGGRILWCDQPCEFTSNPTIMHGGRYATNAWEEAQCDLFVANGCGRAY